ncbi:MAG: hypothetical protein GF331_11350 [Chitinivibrionales bacterium]|nr:hypothetical protein [Chitinivibrionales bacterium]
MSIDIYAHISIPGRRRTTSVSRAEAHFLNTFVSELNASLTLEVGLAYGRSAAHIMSATTCPHHAIDPFQATIFENAGEENLRGLGLANRLVLHQERSHSALPKLVSEGLRFQFAFIDGGHKFDDVFVDFFYVDALLENNGWVMLHDMWMRSIQMTASWIRTNRREYREHRTPCRNLCLFQKRGEDTREWHDFSEFYTCRSMVRHGLFNLRQAMKQ